MVTIKQGGNVGIGTTGPNQLLELAKPGGARLRFNNTTGGGNGVIEHYGSGALSAIWGAQYNVSGSLLEVMTGAGSTQFIINGPGNVGIGTTGPTFKFDVIDSGAGNATMRLGSTGAQSTTFRIDTYNDAGQTANNRNWAFRNRYNNYGLLELMRSVDSTSNPLTTVMAWDRTGNVGIGTTGPGATLHVAGNQGGVDNRNFKVTYPGGGGLLNTELSGLAHLQTDLGIGWTALYAKQVAASYAGVFNGPMIVMNGNVGIGTTGPTAMLDIYRYTATYNTGPILKLTRDYTPSGYGSAIFDGWVGQDALFLGVVSNGDPTNVSNIKMTLLSSGNVGIGTTSPLSGLGWPSPGLEISGGRGTLGLTTTSTGGLATLRFKGPTSGSEMHWNFTDAATPDLTLYSYAGGGYMFTLKGSGNVGIGTTSPSTPLTVKGAIRSIRSDGTSYTNFSAEAGVGTIDSSSGWIYFLRGGTGDYSGSTTMVMNSSGNVGIGTTGPSERLTINGVGSVPISWWGAGLDGSTYQRMVIYTDSTYGVLFEAPAPPSGAVSSRYNYNFSWRGGGSSLFVQGSSGNVGIGTISPGAPLHITKDGSLLTGTTYYNFRLQNAAGNKGIIMGYDTSGTIGIIGHDSANGALAFYTHNGSWGERVRIDQNGNVGIGTTGPLKETRHYWCGRHLRSSS